MKTIISITIGSLVSAYIIYATVMEWMTLGTITVHGRGIPDLKFSGDEIVLGAIIKIGFAMACAFGATGFALFDHQSAKLQALGIKALGAGALCLLMVLALTFTAHTEWHPGAKPEATYPRNQAQAAPQLSHRWHGAAVNHVLGSGDGARPR